MLLLREKTDAILESEGFKGLFIQRADHSNKLPGSIGSIVICSPCGQPLIEIPGISVPFKMNTEEREYAFKLIKLYFKEFGDNVDELWSLKKNRVSLLGFKSNYKLEYRSQYNNLQIGISDKDTEMSYVYDFTDKDALKHYFYFSCTSATADQVKLAISRIPKYQTDISKFYGQVKLKEKQDVRILELTTCQI